MKKITFLGLLFSFFLVMTLITCKDSNEMLWKNKLVHNPTDSVRTTHFKKDNFFHLEIEHAFDGYVAVSFNKELCSGDLVIFSFDRIPKVLDGYCWKKLKDFKEDMFLGGRNDWEIVSYSRNKELGRGWKIEAKRSFLTRDKKMDYQIKNSGLDYISV